MLLVVELRKDTPAFFISVSAACTSLENSEINGVSAQITARCGTLDAVEGRDFDGILANINRNVILDSLPRLAELLKPGGWLLVSGILDQDGPVVTEAAQKAG